MQKGINSPSFDLQTAHFEACYPAQGIQTPVFLTQSYVATVWRCRGDNQPSGGTGGRGCHVFCRSQETNRRQHSGSRFHHTVSETETFFRWADGRAKESMYSGVLMPIHGIRSSISLSLQIPVLCLQTVPEERQRWDEDLQNLWLALPARSRGHVCNQRRWGGRCQGLSEQEAVTPAGSFRNCKCLHLRPQPVPRPSHEASDCWLIQSWKSGVVKLGVTLTPDDPGHSSTGRDFWFSANWGSAHSDAQTKETSARTVTITGFQRDSTS